MRQFLVAWIESVGFGLHVRSDMGAPADFHLTERVSRTPSEWVIFAFMASAPSSHVCATRPEFDAPSCQGPGRSFLHLPPKLCNGRH